MLLNPTSLAVNRILKGHSQSSLSEAAGVSQQRISDLELGHGESRPPTLKKLADALGVEVAALLADPTPEQAQIAERLAKSKAAS